MVSGGYGCDTGGSTDTGSTQMYTMFDTANTIDSNGSIKSWCIGIGTTEATQIRLKIFRLSGSNYNVVWAGPWENLPNNNSVKTTYTFAINSSVPVLSGDYVGFTKKAEAGGWSVGVDETASTKRSKPSDVVNQTATSDWSASGTTNLRIHVSSDSLATLYVKTGGDDTLGGGNWLNAKKNIKDGLRFLPASGTLRVGVGDYSAQPGIRVDKTTSLLCETADTGGGTGTVSLPSAVWAQCSSTVVEDRSSTDYNGSDMDVNGCGSYSVHPNKLAIHNAIAQRFIPSSRCLKKVTLKLQRLVETIDLYVEIREDSAGLPSGNPQAASGQIDYTTVSASSISLLAPADYDIVLDADLGDTNPKWIVVSLTTYDKTVTDNTEYYFVGWGYGATNEQLALRIGNCFSDGWATSTLIPSLYFKTHRNI